MTTNALIIDPGGIIGLPVCRTLARQGAALAVFARESAPVLSSRFCARAIISPPTDRRDELSCALQALDGDRYDEIYICSEEVLSILLGAEQPRRWPGLILPAPAMLRTALSKNLATTHLERAGVPVPRTRTPSSEHDLAATARELDFPLLVKGEWGEASQHVRFAYNQQQLRDFYHEIRELERESGGNPDVQEFIPGPGYSVGALCLDGRCLRVCAHRRLLMYPPEGGPTVRGVTERPPELITAALGVFESIEYSGLGHVEFIRDTRDGKFKFIEINPRIWGSIGLSAYAGVDLFSAYRTLVKGLAVEPDLRFREGVYFHRISKEVRYLRRRPRRVFGLLADCLNPIVKSDFMWRDPRPHLAHLLNGRSSRG